jgi:hypothetical protein
MLGTFKRSVYGMELRKVKKEYTDETNITKQYYELRLYYNDRAYIVVKPVFKNDYAVMKALALDDVK